MSTTKIDMSQYHNALGFRHKLYRMAWTICWNLFCRPFPRNIGGVIRKGILRGFGAKIHPTAKVYAKAQIYFPANLIMDANSCLGPDVECYNVDLIHLKANATVSQGAYLCTASHDITNHLHPLITAPIIIEDQAWVAARAYIGMGVTVGQGAVVGATASVYKDVDPWTVVGGNPAKFIKQRVVR